MAQEETREQKIARLEAEEKEARQRELEEELEKAEVEEKRAAVAASLGSGAVPSFAAAEAVKPEEEKGLVTRALEMFDVPAAAARKGLAVGAVKGPSAGLEAGIEQFKSMEPGLAPTGKELMGVLGVSTKPMSLSMRAAPGSSVETPEEAATRPGEDLPLETSAAGILGVPAEVLLDPTGPMLKGAGVAAQVGADVGHAALKYPVAAGAAATKGAVGMAASALGNVAETAGRLVSGPTAGPAIGAAVERTGKGLARLPETTLGFLKNLKPKFREQLADQLSLAERYGIDTTKLTQSREFLFGEDAFVTKQAAIRRQMFGADEMQNYLQSKREVQTAVNGLVESLTSGKTVRLAEAAGPAVQSAEQIGRSIRDDYQRVIKDLYEKNKVRYSTIANEIGSAPISAEAAKKIQGSTDALLGEILKLQQEFSDLQRSAVGPTNKAKYAANIEELNDILRSLERGRSTGDVRDSIRKMQQIGEAAYGDAASSRIFGISPLIDPSVADLKPLYAKLRDVVIANAEAISPKLAADLKRSNEAQKAFFESNSRIGKYILDDRKYADSDIYRLLIEEGDERQRRALLKILGEDADAIGNVRAKFLDDIQRKTADGDTIPVSTLKNLNNKKVQAIAADMIDPEVMKDFRGLIELSRDLGVKDFNTSRTAVTEVLGSANKIGSLLGMRAVSESIEAKAFKDALSKATLGDLIAMKGKGLYPPEVIDSVIAERKRLPGFMSSMQRASSMGDLHEDIASSASKLAANLTPTEKWGAVTEYLGAAAADLGQGLIPFGTPYDRVGKVMQAFSHAYRTNPDSQSPVRVPPEDLSEVKAYIDRSDASSILKARNKLMLDQAGILLNPGEFTRPTVIIPSAKSGVGGSQDQLYKAFKDVMKARERPEVEAERPKR